MKNLISFTIVFILLISCSDSSTQSIIGSSDDSENDDTNIDPPADSTYDWLLPNGSITGILNPFPLMTNPTLTKINEVNFMNDDDIVAIVSLNNIVKVYPYKYIGSYESVNDVIDGRNIAITYCPITKSALCVDRDFENQLLTLRASGYLFKDNVILLDEKSDTYWSQMLTKCVKGKFENKTPTTYNFIQTSWKTANNYFNEALVFTNSSVSSSSGNGDTKIQSEKNLKVDISDGEETYGIINTLKTSDQEVYIYRYDSFNDLKIFTPTINGIKSIVIGDASKEYITSYFNESNLTFTTIENEFPVVMKDSEGNRWNVFGLAVSGPKEGQQLKSPNAYVAIGSAWKAFYNTLIVQE